MTRAEPNVVGNENVALFQRLEREDVEKRPDGPWKRSDKGRNAIGRLRDGPAFFDSRTTEEKEVRTRAAAASSTIEINRRQINSTAIAFSIGNPSFGRARTSAALSRVDASDDAV